MEKDTVLLSIDKYNALRDFRNEIERGNTYLINGSSGFFITDSKFISTDLCIEFISKVNNSLQKQIDELKEINASLNEENEKLKEINASLNEENEKLKVSKPNKKILWFFKNK